MYPLARIDIDLGIWFTFGLGVMGLFFPYLLLSLFTQSAAMVRVVRLLSIPVLLYGAASIYDRYIRDESQFALSHEEKRQRIYADALEQGRSR